MYKSRILYLLLLIGFFFYSVLFSQKSTFLLFVVALVYPWISLIFLLLAIAKVKVSIEAVEPLGYKGEECKVRVRIENKSFLPVPMMRLKIGYTNCLSRGKDSRVFLSSLLGRSSQEITISLTSDYVGELKFYPEQISFYDGTRICCRRKRFRAKKGKEYAPGKEMESLLILPREYKEFVEIQEHWTQIDNGRELITISEQGNDASELFDVREYNEGDKIARIHWKLTAKCNQFMIKEYSMEQSHHPLLVLNFSYSGSNLAIELLDAYFEAFMMLAELHLSQGHAFDVLYYNSFESQVLVQSIEQKEELIQLMHDLYDSVEEGQTHLVMEEVMRELEEHRYSNLYLFTFEYRSELEELLLQECLMILVEHVAGNGGFREQLEGKLRDLSNVQLVHPETVEKDLEQMVFVVCGGEPIDGEE